MDALEGRATFIWYVSLAGWIFFILRAAPCFLILLSHEKALFDAACSDCKVLVATVLQAWLSLCC